MWMRRTSEAPHRHPALHPVVSFGRRHGGRPFRPLVAHFDRWLGYGGPLRLAVGVAGRWLGRPARPSARPSACWPTATPNAGRNGRPHPNRRSEWTISGRNGRPPYRPPKPTAGWNGCLSADGRRGRVDVLWMRFSQKIPKVTNLRLVLESREITRSILPITCKVANIPGIHITLFRTFLLSF
jgi:hypothetical protein